MFIILELNGKPYLRMSKEQLQNLGNISSSPGTELYNLSKTVLYVHCTTV